MVFTIDLQILLGGFLIGLVFGAVVHRTHFCTLGAVSDWVNLGDRGRFRSWCLAIGVAMAGALLLEGLGLIALGDTHPPYRMAGFAWARYLLGGLMFGSGMALAGGCISKNLVRLGGGNLKSLIVVIVAGGFAYLMTKTAFYGMVFDSWLQPLSIDLSRFGAAGQDLGSLLATAAGDPLHARLMVGGLLAAGLLVLVLRAADFRRSRDLVLGGVMVGLAVAGGWYLTAGPLGRAWQEHVLWLDQPPLGVGAQSLTFVNPLGETLNYLAQPDEWRLVTFGVVAVAGVVLGAFAHAVISRGLRVEWFTSWADLLRHLIGAILMGIGGVLAMGCSIGQGITGVSTLALGSFLALGAIVLGAATTMKVQYYKMLYEEASLLDALLSGWADLHLLPQSARRLEAL